MPSFQIVELSSQPFAYLKRTAPMAGIGQTMAESFATLGAAFGTAGAAPAGPPLTHYLSYDDNSTTFEVGFPARAADADRLAKAGLTIGSTPGGQVMKATHVGPYDSLVSTYTAMQEDMRRQNLKGTVDMWEIYMSPPETPPEQTVTEVLWPVTSAG